MNGYKTGGNWADVTSTSRNEVVFDGRHKAYGAFYIRQRYSNSLLVSLLSSISLMALCAIIPYVMRKTSPPLPPPPDNDEKVIPYVLPPTSTVKPPPPPHQHITPPPPSSTDNSSTIVMIEHPDTSTKKSDPTPAVTPGSGPPNPTPGPVIPPGGGTSGPPVPISHRDTFVLVAGTMPKFLHGDLNSYLNNHINYPADESQRGVQGTVYASFIIEKDGSISNVTLKRGVSNGPNLNREALRVLAEMPSWSPAKQDGHPVRIQFTIPINFKLR